MSVDSLFGVLDDGGLAAPSIYFCKRKKVLSTEGLSPFISP